MDFLLDYKYNRNLTFDNMEINILVLTARHICFYPIICNFKISAVFNFLDLLFPDLLPDDEDKYMFRFWHICYQHNKDVKLFKDLCQ